MMPSSQQDAAASNPVGDDEVSEQRVNQSSSLFQESFEPISPPLTNLETRSLRVPSPALPQSTLSSDATSQSLEPIAFSDLPSDHWAKPAIDSLSAQRWLQGFPDGSFRPDAPITRAEFAAQIAQVFSELPLQSSTSITFQDVPETHWGQASIQRAVQAGFLRGYPGRTFRPNQPVSRAQLIVAVASGLDLEAEANTDVLLQPYQDRNQVPAWAIPSLVAAIRSGLVADAEQLNRLRPQAAATRAEVAAMLHQALVYMGRADPISPADAD
ncbi:S-layer homology domain-containing protein [Halomicronema hongdechloris]|nr:S-layer homology domain-containing protein [Halomicronema hongdechloris]